jgi:hypothetical protein
MSEEEEGYDAAPELSASLACLVGAVDRFKQTMGYSEDSEDAAMAQIQSFVNDVQQENITLRKHAEDDIMVCEF